MKNHKLHTINSTGFKTPNAYFESLEASIVSKLKSPQHSRNINSTGFKLPEGYFEDLDAKILHAVHKTDKTNVISLISWRKVAYISGIAASLIVVFNLIFSNSQTITFDNLETASIENYLINEDLNAYDIAPYLSIHDLNSDDFVENTLNTSDIEDYLLQNSDVENLLTD